MTTRQERWTTVVLSLVAAVLLAAALIVVTPSWAGRSDPAERNVAVADQRLTDAVTKDVRRGLDRVLVYDYRHPHAADAATRSFLTGQAARQYAEMFGVLRSQGAQQQLVHRSVVTAVASEQLTKSSGEMLVFLEQQTVRDKDGAVSQGRAQIKVTVIHREGSWKLVSMKLL